MGKAEALDKWLATATHGLCDEAVTRISEEAKTHFDDAFGEAQRRGESESSAIQVALGQLGDAAVANHGFLRVHLTAQEAIDLAKPIAHESKLLLVALLSVVSTSFMWTATLLDRLYANSHGHEKLKLALLSYVETDDSAIVARLIENIDIIIGIGAPMLFAVLFACIWRYLITAFRIRSRSRILLAPAVLLRSPSITLAFGNLGAFLLCLLAMPSEKFWVLGVSALGGQIFFIGLIVFRRLRLLAKLTAPENAK